MYRDRNYGPLWHYGLVRQDEGRGSYRLVGPFASTFAGERRSCGHAFLQLLSLDDDSPLYPSVLLGPHMSSGRTSAHL